MRQLAHVLGTACVAAALAGAGCSSQADDASASNHELDDTADAAPWADALRQAIATLDARNGTGALPGYTRDGIEHDALAPLSWPGLSPERAFWIGVRTIEDVYHSGHAWVFPEDASKCGAPDLPWASTSWVGACTQPYGDHAVVTAVDDDDPLGLAPGDEIVSIDGRAGDDMTRFVFGQPMCATGVSSQSAYRALVTTSLFAAASIGSVVGIKHPNGAVETKRIDRLASRPKSCRDPFGRTPAYVAQATLRSDGVGVLHVPSFFMQGDEATMAERLEKALLAELDRLRSASMIVVDVRGNPGGATIAGFALLSELGARTANIAHCAQRIPGTQQTTGDFDYVTQPSPTAYRGKVAILADGASFSAADYFVRAARLATDALVVGRPEAGAYGGATDTQHLATTPALQISTDPWRCTAPDGTPLEGWSVAPDVEQDLDPASLARGVDSDLETAIARLRARP